MKPFFVILMIFSLLVSPAAASAQTGKLIFGLGPEANDAVNKPLVKEAPIKMLTSWYNGPKDLQWMSGWKKGTVPSSYAKGYAMHLIIFSNDSEKQLNGPKGDACGRAYPLSSAFQEDVIKLADIFKGNGPLYVTMFTEFQTYPCKDNQWSGNENYFNALKDQYRIARQTFKNSNPNARVSIGWGGWQARYDDKSKGGGRSLFQHFADIMKESEFQSFQSMQSDHNIEDIRDMTTILSQYGPVMLAHYKPDNRSQQTFDRDLKAFFTDSYINEITSKGLFAMSFMDHHNLDNSKETYSLAKNAVSRYATERDTPPPKVIRPTSPPTPLPTPTSTPTVSSSNTPSPTVMNESFEDNSVPIQENEQNFFEKIINFFANLFSNDN